MVRAYDPKPDSKLAEHRVALARVVAEGYYIVQVSASGTTEIERYRVQDYVREADRSKSTVRVT